MVRSIVDEPKKQELYWRQVVGVDNIDYTQVYSLNIVKISDRKIAEFNFKVLHCILPCGVNLKKWKQKDNANCDICNVEESIEHLLYYCNYANNFWKELSNIIGWKICLKHVIYGIMGDEASTFIISLIAYLIYKEWLINSFANRCQTGYPSIDHFRSDLIYRANVYRQLKWNKICMILDKILTAL